MRRSHGFDIVNQLFGEQRRALPFRELDERAPTRHSTVSQPRRRGKGKVQMSRFKLILGVLFNVAIFGCSLFLPAGTLDWWRAWVFLGVVFVGAVASTVILFRANKGLLQERFKPPVQKGQPLADKIVVLLLIASFVGLIIFIPLDVFRLHLIAKPGTLASFFGLVLFIAGWWIMTLALRENAFAAPVVRHQEERQQTVIDSGVYSVVRHPMYSGAVLLMVGMPLWLESYAAALLASVPIGILVVRILIEEQFLRRELKGYDAYTERVRYRLVPFLW
jgi:protein-S-isoprenylcysteine O-methyltransferase Ste14